MHICSAHSNLALHFTHFADFFHFLTFCLFHSSYLLHFYFTTEYWTSTPLEIICDGQGMELVSSSFSCPSLLSASPLDLPPLFLPPLRHYHSELIIILLLFPWLSPVLLYCSNYCCWSCKSGDCCSCTTTPSLVLTAPIPLLRVLFHSIRPQLLLLSTNAFVWQT